MKQESLYARYPRKSDFLFDYNPDLQAKLIRLNVVHSEIALNEHIPSLGLLRSTYSDELALEWLKIQFGSLNDYAEQGVGMRPEQLNELSSLYLAEYYYLNAAEVCFFIARLKLGKYGQFYGAIGPMKIMSAMCEYIKERRQSLDSAERESERRRREEEINNRKGCISFAEYQELKMLTESGNEEARGKLGMQ